MTHTISKPLAHLRTFPQFVICRFVPSVARPGKTDKIPVNPATGRNCSAMDPASWMTADAAEATAQRLGQTYGIGFVLTPATRVFCVDIDGALQADNTWSPLALSLCARFPGAAIEVSQSGTGLHIWGTYEGDEPLHTKRNEALGLELYTAERFIALGSAANGEVHLCHTQALQALIAEYFPPSAPRIAPVPTGAPAMPDEEVLHLWLASAPATSSLDGFPSPSEFYAADETALARKYPDDKGGQGRPSDRSKVDAAAARGLAYFTRDADQLERILRGSALLREKWDTHRSYLTRTIQSAIERQEAAYTPRAGRPEHAAALFAGEAATGPAGMVLEAPASRLAAVAAATELSFMAAAGGAIPATIEKVIEVLMSAESGVEIARDDFNDQILVTYKGEAQRPLEDEDLTDLRARFGRRGFKPIAQEIMRSAVNWVARNRKFDSAIQRLNGLVWDGVPRMSQAMVRYYGCDDTPYAASVGEYLFTALAGRCLVPGIKADMVPVLSGLQGVGKTSGVEALAPTPESFGEVDLKKSDTDLARSLRGKQLVEWAELNGLTAREQEATKAWISRPVEEWVPKFKEIGIRYPRRCVLVGTGNVRGQLIPSLNPAL